MSDLTQSLIIFYEEVSRHLLENILQMNLIGQLFYNK